MEEDPSEPWTSEVNSDCPEARQNGRASQCDLRLQWPEFRNELRLEQAEFEGRVIKDVNEAIEPVRKSIENLAARIDRLYDYTAKTCDKIIDKTRAVEHRIAILEPNWEDEPTEVRSRRVDSFRQLEQEKELAIAKARLSDEEKDKAYRQRLTMKVITVVASGFAAIVAIAEAVRLFAH